MDVDLRGRLDPRGERQGKVIAHKVSELRAIERLEGICKGMHDGDFALINKDTESPYYQKFKNLDGGVTISGTLSLGGADSSAASKEIGLYCDAMVEENEERLVEIIQSVGDGEEVDGWESLEQELCVRPRVCRISENSSGGAEEEDADQAPSAEQRLVPDTERKRRPRKSKKKGRGQARRSKRRDGEEL
jgi:hypothetical protein